MKLFGFTLIEMLIVLLLLSILSAIAYPQYSKHLVRVRRTYATVALMDAACKMEEYYVVNNTYKGAVLDKKYSDNKYYYLRVIPQEDTYTLHAIPLGLQAKDDALCKELSVDQYGNRYQSGFGTVAECWH